MLFSSLENVRSLDASSEKCLAIGVMLGHNCRDTRVLLLRKIRVGTTTFDRSSLDNTFPRRSPDTRSDHHSSQLENPLPDGFHSLPRKALIMLGNSLPSRTETRPLSWPNCSAWGRVVRLTRWRSLCSFALSARARLRTSAV